jgi:4-diphosphocytidyl-2-C-methyl-D-erythritol kinase
MSSRRSERMHIRQTADTSETLAPAKVNLFLAVIEKRADGYHEIETVMSAVTIYDTLIFVPHEREDIELECRLAQGVAARSKSQRHTGSLADKIPTGPDNLVWRAVDLVRREARLAGGAKLTLIKRIPSEAGLGGASSDAAAALVAANTAWKLGWQRERLAELAAQLGSDVPFFLTRGAAICTGRGEKIESLTPMRLHFVIIRPPVGLRTSDVYRKCRPTDNRGSAARFTKARRAGDVAGIGSKLQNDLEAAAKSFTPWIDQLEREFQHLGVREHQMSGSGSSYFGLCRTARHARRLAARLRARNIGVVFAATTATGF